MTDSISSCLKNVVLYVIYALIGVFAALGIALIFLGCSDDDGGRNTDIEHCVETHLRIKECRDSHQSLEDRSASARKECEEKTEFDYYDRCYFDCANDEIGCDDFDRCLGACE